MTPKTAPPQSSLLREAGEALAWYEEQIRALHKYMSTPKVDAVEAVVVALSLDRGNRARAILSRLQPTSTDRSE